MLRLGPPAARDVGWPVVTSPPVTLKTVWRREDLDEGSGAEDGGGSGCCWVVEDGGGGGGTEKRARSWASVSRMSEVMSWLERRAFVKILGGGNLFWYTKGQLSVIRGRDIGGALFVAYGRLSMP